MKKNLKKYVIILIVIFGIMCLIPSLRFSILSLFEGDIKVENNNYQNKISYYVNEKYFNIVEYKNYIKVIEKEEITEWNCFAPPCLKIKKFYRLKFNKKHMEMIRDTITELSVKYNDEIISETNLNYYEQTILKSIIEKDESYIEDYLSFYKEN